MNTAEWNKFLQELRDMGYGEEVRKFEEIEKEIEKEMEIRKATASMIEHANLVQTVNTAKREGRVVIYRTRDGQNIIH